MEHTGLELLISFFPAWLLPSIIHILKGILFANTLTSLCLGIFLS